MYTMMKIFQWNGGGSQSSVIERAVSEKGLDIPALRAAMDGRVIVPGDAEYDAARTVFTGGIDRHPAAILRPRDTAEVAAVIALARQTGLELAVRSGGHSTAGFGVNEGGLVLDLSNLKSLDINTLGRSAWAGSGLTAVEDTQKVGEYGLATGFGDTGSVGIGGITLGGGIGYLVRKYGMTIDSLLAAEIVTADGQVLIVDENNHPDLFWAIRGGGGNFGVVTRFKFRLYEVGDILGGMLILPATADVIAGVMQVANAAPDELSLIANVMAAPPMPFIPPEVHGKMIVMILLAYAGSVEAGQRAVSPLKALAAPLADMLRPMRYAELYPPDDETYHPTAAGWNMFIDHVDQATAQTILDFLQNSDAVMRVAQLRPLGGAMGRVPADATAFAHRKSPIMVNLAAFYTSPEDKAVRQAWIEKFAAAIDQGDPAVYSNFMGDEGMARVQAAYPGETWERLRRIKRQYDPSNLFHLNQNIPPAD